MKVYIGPFVPWWQSRVFKDYMDKKYDYDWSEPTTPFEKFLDKFEDALQWVYHHTVNRIFSRMKRKIKVKIHNYDTWGMDQTLAYIILPMLKQLKETKHGSPYIDQEDLPEELRMNAREQQANDNGYWDKELNATEEEIEAASKKFHSQWDWVMEQMIWSFEQQMDEDEGRSNYYDPYLPGEEVERIKETIIGPDGQPMDDPDPLFDEEFMRKMGKFNKEKHAAYHARVQRGYILFGKYYQALWD